MAAEKRQEAGFKAVSPGGDAVNNPKRQLCLSAADLNNDPSNNFVKSSVCRFCSADMLIFGDFS